jgi:Fe-Mn family superoxide dismutase
MLMKLSLPPLPYALDALEPHVSRRTLAAHHGQHHAAYLDKTRSLVRGSPLDSASLAEIVVSDAAHTDSALFNAAAQAWNHGFYWSSMRPGGGGAAYGAIAPWIRAGFGNQRAFGLAFAAAAGERFGSGWTWLVLDGDRLRITATSNAQTPLTTRQAPLLALDIWEHAYYLDYEHRRSDYIAVFLDHLVNWDFANQKLSLALGARAQTPIALASAAHGDSGDSAIAVGSHSRR